MEEGPFYPGRGVELTVYNEDASVQTVFSKIILEEEEDARTWQVFQRQKSSLHEESTEILYEFETDSFRVPRFIRFQSPERGIEERQSFLASSVEEAKGSISPTEILGKLFEERFDELKRDIPRVPEIYKDLSSEGYETLELADKQVYTERFSAPLPAPRSGTITVWISPDIPGRIARIDMNKRRYAQITDWIDSASEKLLKDSEQAVVYDSEGNPENPIVIASGEVYSGSVASGGTSYYALSDDWRSDLFVEIKESSVPLTLKSYRGDSSFTDWISSSEGVHPNIEEYFVDGGDRIYFSVHNSSDVGVSYTIHAIRSYDLDPLGVRIYAPFRENARLVPRNSSQQIAISPGELRFYAIAPGEKSSLALRILHEHEAQTAFHFLDVISGGYSGIVSSRKGKEQTIGLKGLHSGSLLYFYLVSQAEGESSSIRLIAE